MSQIFEYVAIDLIVVIRSDLLPIGGLQALAEMQLVQAEVAAAGVAEDIESATDGTEGRRLGDCHFFVGEHGSVSIIILARGCFQKPLVLPAQPSNRRRQVGTRDKLGVRSTLVGCRA